MEESATEEGVHQHTAAGGKEGRTVWCGACTLGAAEKRWGMPNGKTVKGRASCDAAWPKHDQAHKD